MAKRKRRFARTRKFSKRPRRVAGGGRAQTIRLEVIAATPAAPAFSMAQLQSGMVKAPPPKKSTF